jgi:formylglycine-generating enzyme required for sulfatase activity
MVSSFSRHAACARDGVVIERRPRGRVLRTARAIIRDVQFVRVEAGTFLMGWQAGHPGERPVHEVWLDAFLIARTPVTNAEYARFLDAVDAAPPPFWHRPGFTSERQPVVGLSWDEATSFAAWAGARLPTEAEWEKAARGDLRGARFPWGDRSPETRFTAPPEVGSTPANPLGLTDLSGVCHEWCADWYGETFYATSPPMNPRGPAAGARRVSRGGAWRHADPWSPVAHRSSLPPHLRYSDYGLRLARDA